MSFVVGLIGGAISLVLCLTAEKESAIRVLSLLGIGVLGIMAVAGFFKLLTELFRVSPRDRTTPEKALKAYLGSVNQQRWKAAFSCLSWAAKDGRDVMRPAMLEVELAEQTFQIRQAGDVREYWSDFVGMLKARGKRSFSYKLSAARRVSESVAIVPMGGSISMDTSTASLTSEVVRRHGPGALIKVTFTCVWPVYERDGLWYLLMAGFPANFKIR